MFPNHNCMKAPAPKPEVDWSTTEAPVAGPRRPVMSLNAPAAASASEATL